MPAGVLVLSAILCTITDDAVLFSDRSTPESLKFRLVTKKIVYDIFVNCSWVATRW
jgi:hypothetical protein